MTDRLTAALAALEALGVQPTGIAITQPTWSALYAEGMRYRYATPEGTVAHWDGIPVTIIPPPPRPPDYYTDNPPR